MKTLKIIILFALALSIFSCKKDLIDSSPDELSTAKNSLVSSFDSLNTRLANAASELALDLSDPAKIRTQMVELFSQTSFTIEFGYVSPEGLLEIVEPPIYYPQEGFDISDQAHIIKAFSTIVPVLSNTFFAVEGFYAAVDIHPIVKDNQALGGVTSLFFPEVILGRIIEPLVDNQSFEMWVMQKDGTILYDQDSEEIGLNVFTDPLYAEFSELLLAAEKIAAEDDGETTYSFFQTNTNTEVTKKTYWTTITINDNEWKLVWVEPVSA